MLSPHAVAVRNGNPHVLVAIAACAVLQFAYTELAPFQAIFGSASLGGGQWGMVIASGAAIVIEIEKIAFRFPGVGPPDATGPVSVATSRAGSRWRDGAGAPVCA